jgi:methylisocitrate lyase
MNKAALDVYQSIKAKGTQKDVIDKMQTREELYKSINYYEYEKSLDRFNK